jgi:hypothetical protein
MKRKINAITEDKYEKKRDEAFFGDLKKIKLPDSKV